jgi:hypothetical protein
MICLFVPNRDRNKSRFLELVMFGNLYFIRDNIYTLTAATTTTVTMTTKTIGHL